MEIDPFPAAQYPAVLTRLLVWSTWSWVLIVILDIGAMIVNIMAYTGAQSQEDRTIIKQTHITFSAAGHHIQRTMIALPSLGLIMHITLPVLISIRLTRLKRDFTLARTKQTRRWVALVPLLYHLICLASWAVLIAFQTEYVPILGTDKLPECVKFGDELSQCGMLTANWMLGMVLCAAHLLLVVMLAAIVTKLSYPQIESAPLNPTSTRRGSSPLPASTQTRTPGPVPYYAVPPPDASTFSGSPRPSYNDQPPPPPYSEAKRA